MNDEGSRSGDKVPARLHVGAIADGQFVSRATGEPIGANDLLARDLADLRKHLAQRLPVDDRRAAVLRRSPPGLQIDARSNRAIVLGNCLH